MGRTSSRLSFCALLFVCVVSASCAEQDPVGVVKPVHAKSASVASDPFFIAWTESSFRSAPIQTQSIGGPDSHQQYRQYTGFVADANVRAFAAANPGKLYINGDEPDQSCIAPYDYAATYHDYVVAIRGADPTAGVSPAGFAEPNEACGCPPGSTCFTSMHSISYADQFYNAYLQRYGVAPPVTEWRFHDFGLSDQGNLAAWWSHVKNEAAWSVSHGANMVLGSWGFLDWTEPLSTFLVHEQQAMDWVRNDSRINQVVWWSYENTGYIHYLANADGTLTQEGQVYASGVGVLSVLIQGSSRATPRSTCYWNVYVSGGVAPYQYAWTVNGQAVGGNSAGLTYTNTGSSFVVAVNVTDQFGVAKQTSKSISVQSGTPCTF